MAKAKDLTGQRFGKLVVQYRSNQPGQRPVWHCLCDCGKECDVLGTNLRNGNTKSCGCLKAPSLIGEKFGHWTVIDKAQSSGYSSQWLCRCDCGTERVVSRKSLVAGTSKSCGCTKIKYKDDYTGQKFGNWLVLEKSRENSNSFWNCQCCSCGETKELNISRLMKGQESCKKCSSKIRVDLTGKKFGKLTPISINWEITREKQKDTTYWNCQCECGNIIVVSAKALRDQEKTHCGCSTIYSKGENKIEEVLQNLNYDYIKQKTFSDLIGNVKPLRFDFYLPKEQVAIEYQGEQHYKIINAWENDSDNFELRQLYDKKKKDYCINNNIRLIEIPYWDLDKINNEYIKKKIMEVLNDNSYRYR